MFRIENSIKIIALLCALFVVVLIALILLLPHSKSTQTTSIKVNQSRQNGPNQSTGSTIPQSNSTTNGSTHHTTSSTTIASINGSTASTTIPGQSSTKNSIRNGTNSNTTKLSTTTITSTINSSYYTSPNYYYGTTTVVYVYCVGSQQPFFNQSYYAALYPSGIQTWNQTTNYTIPMFGGACGSYDGSIYCLGDSPLLQNNRSRSAYYANISSSGISGWNATTNYPIPFSYGQCATYGNHMYCVGTSNSEYSNRTYYSKLSGSGIGGWNKTTSYPVPFYGGSCSIYDGYIYCTGDSYTSPDSQLTANQTKSIATFIADNKNKTISYLISTVISMTSADLANNTVGNYYAPISQYGIGPWTKMQPIPGSSGQESCQIDLGVIYCEGGSNLVSSLSTEVSDGVLNASSLGDLLSSGVINTYVYDTLLSQLNTNSTSNQTIQQISAVYAPILSSGAIGGWNTTTSYSLSGSLQGSSCVTYYGNLYCIGTSSGDQQSVIYANLTTHGLLAWTEGTEYPVPFYDGYCSLGS